MMSAVPYSHKGELVSILENNKTSDDDVDNIMQCMKEAQTFRVPHQESLPTVKDYKLFYEFMKSPYDYYLIEMPTDNGWLIMFILNHQDVVDHTKEVNKTIDEYNKTTKKKWWQLTKKESPEREKQINNVPNLTCALFFKDSERWSSWSSFEVEMDETGYEVKKEKSRLGKDEKSLPQEVLDRFAWTIFEFMVAVNTSNIKQLEIKPPKMINAKRAKKGKPLLEGYKYLDLIQREQLSHDVAGTGAAKRMHWRRGHIRRLADRTTWVRPALIGKGSFVDKTYRLNP